jgi:hypothetical protein
VQLGHLGIEADARPGVYWVDINRMKTAWGFGFGTDGWHPYTETLMDVEDRGVSEYEHTTLRRVHELWRPTSLADVIFDVLPRQISALDSLRPWGTLASRVWLFHPKRIGALLVKSARSKAGKPPGEQQFGPCSTERAHENLARLIAVERSIRRDGYRPFEHEDGLVKGVLLIRGDEYRFLIWNGQHRVPALAHIGTRRVAVRLGTPDIPMIVHDAELDSWRSYVAGALPPSLMTALFREQFQEMGQGKARRLGLL